MVANTAAYMPASCTTKLASACELSPQDFGVFVYLFSLSFHVVQAIAERKIQVVCLGVLILCVFRPAPLSRRILTLTNAVPRDGSAWLSCTRRSCDEVSTNTPPTHTHTHTRHSTTSAAKCTLLCNYIVRCPMS